MSLQTKRALGRFFIFSLIGLLMEVFFTASLELAAGNWNMHGKTSPWMMFDYGLLGLVLMPIARPMIRRKIPLPVRAIIYMIGIFAVEFLSGWIFDLCGLEIWSYKHLPGNLYGYIAPQYVPVWYFTGLWAEFLYKRVDMIALALLKGLTPQDLETWNEPRQHAEAPKGGGGV
ncbi:MAG: hypothetical protein JXQ73_22000 [Phycisphaerae bacterium]|nr:hypothetical protein [Phycisphaerae bacterium]